MATYEEKGQLTYKDEAGNLHLLHPKTKMDCVDGLGDALGGKAPASHTKAKNNPHGVTASQVGARPNNWMPTASDVGARPNTWMPTALDVGAAIGAKILTSGADLNEIWDSGMYRLVGTHTNMPSGAAHGQLLVIHGGADTIAQIVFKFSSAEMWVRTGSGSKSNCTFTEWRQVYTTGFKPTAADVGAAPSGFGLGTVCVDADWNTITKTGFYRGTTNSPDSNYLWYGFHMDQQGDSGGYKVQIAFPAYWNDAKLTSCMCVRSMHAGTWGAWEWENPPMQLGTEYRTTERHAGKPVYRKLLQYVANGFGTASGYADLVIPHGTSVVTSCAGIEAKIIENGTVEYKLPYLASNGGITEIIQCDNAGIKIRTWNTAWGYAIIYLDLAYTKD